MSQRKVAERLGVSKTTVQKVYAKHYTCRTKTNQLVTDIKDSLIKGAAKQALCLKFSISDRVLMAVIEELKETGYLVEENEGFLSLCRQPLEPDQNTHDARWKGEKIVRFGLCGDNQINSKYTQLTHAHNLYDIYEKEGIKVVYHTGDMDEGEEMRQGHKYECYNQGADDHVAEIIKNYPARGALRLIL